VNSENTPGSFAHLLALDVEATCDDGPAVPRQEMETIEIGAIIVNAECEVIDEFQTFIKPIRHPRLTPFCTRLTSIRQADVDGAPYFYDAMEAFRAWFSRYPSLITWGSWGGYDKKQLEQDCAFNGMSSSVYLPGRHVNLKEACKEALRLSTKPGLHQAIHIVGLEFSGTHHRGIDDARNIGRLLPYILGKARPPPLRVGHQQRS
jgi:inhibitor of KinA sporulation pathway (predicted exonuclease)